MNEDPKSSPHQCSCCDYFTLETRGNFDICPVCFWEDDGTEFHELDNESGANHGSTLRQARSNFSTLGASESEMLSHVLPESQRSHYARKFSAMA